jgi:hypothetical protein
MCGGGVGGQGQAAALAALLDVVFALPPSAPNTTAVGLVVAVRPSALCH